MVKIVIFFNIYFMKYIKNYRIFESVDLDEILEECRDILLPIRDEYIDTDVKYGDENDLSSNITLTSDIFIRIGKPSYANYPTYRENMDNYHNMYKFIDSFDHLNSYMNSVGYELSELFIQQTIKSLSGKQSKSYSYDCLDKIENASYALKSLKAYKVCYIRFHFTKK